MGFKEVEVHLSKFTVGIAGAGGLGSNCAVALARSGIGKLIICDFDTVEVSNLTRQYYFSDQTGMLKISALTENIRRINTSVIVTAHHDKLTRDNIPSIFNGCNVIVEALDKAEMKEMFIETVQISLKGIPVISGSGLAGWGNTGTIRCREIDETLFVCGDESSEESESMPVMAPRVGIVANMQANMVVELLMKKR